MVNVINDEDEDGKNLWTFKEILGHRNQGRSYEPQILWDISKKIWEPLAEMKLLELMSVA